MGKCWICEQWFDKLSEEHIIPRLFTGLLVTKGFSCAGCNRRLGKEEEKLAPISILMSYLDKADGSPAHVLPAGESERKPRKWLYGDDLETELFTDGVARFNGWERPVGRPMPGVGLCVPGTITVEGNYHRSLIKALLSFACYEGLPQNVFGGPLRYLRGADECLPELEPGILGLPTKGMFARVWLIAPPADDITVLYGAVVYGPIANIYVLCRDLRFGKPFACEIRAFQKEARVYAGVSEYMKWREELLRELRPEVSDRHIGSVGVYTVREARQSGLLVCETSPGAVMRGLGGNGGVAVPLPSTAPEFAYSVRFEKWVESLQSEIDHSRFLRRAGRFDESMERLRSGG